MNIVEPPVGHDQDHVTRLRALHQRAHELALQVVDRQLDMRRRRQPELHRRLQEHRLWALAARPPALAAIGAAAASRSPRSAANR